MGRGGNILYRPLINQNADVLPNYLLLDKLADGFDYSDKQQRLQWADNAAKLIEGYLSENKETQREIERVLKKYIDYDFLFTERNSVPQPLTDLAQQIFSKREFLPAEKLLAPFLRYNLETGMEYNWSLICDKIDFKNQMLFSYPGWQSSKFIHILDSQQKKICDKKFPSRHNYFLTEFEMRAAASKPACKKCLNKYQGEASFKTIFKDYRLANSILFTELISKVLSYPESSSYPAQQNKALNNYLKTSLKLTNQQQKIVWQGLNDPEIHPYDSNPHYFSPRFASQLLTKQLVPQETLNLFLFSKQDLQTANWRSAESIIDNLHSINTLKRLQK